MNSPQQQPAPPPQQAPPLQSGPVKPRERKQVGGNNIWCVFSLIHLSVTYQLLHYRSEYVTPTRVDVTSQKRSCLVGERPLHPLLHRFVDGFMCLEWHEHGKNYMLLLTDCCFYSDCWSRGGRSCPDQWWKCSTCCCRDQSWWVGFLENTSMLARNKFYLDQYLIFLYTWSLFHYEKWRFSLGENDRLWC